MGHLGPHWINASPGQPTAHHDHVLPVELDANHRQDGVRVACHSRTTRPRGIRRDHETAP
ncbi:MAG: hypothetical protein V3W44_10285 [Dehalococcoidales bacterium]